MYPLLKGWCVHSRYKSCMSILTFVKKVVLNENIQNTSEVLIGWYFHQLQNHVFELEVFTSFSVEHSTVVNIKNISFFKYNAYIYLLKNRVLMYMSDTYVLIKQFMKFSVRFPNMRGFLEYRPVNCVYIYIPVLNCNYKVLKCIKV